jgi:hypothetical protein
MIAEKSKVPKKRKFVYDENFYDKEESKPFTAPNWTSVGYQGRLKLAVKDACDRRNEISRKRTPFQLINDYNDSEVAENDEDGNEEEA